MVQNLLPTQTHFFKWRWLNEWLYRLREILTVDSTATFQAGFQQQIKVWRLIQVSSSLSLIWGKETHFQSPGNKCGMRRQLWCRYRIKLRGPGNCKYRSGADCACVVERPGPEIKLEKVKQAVGVFLGRWCYPSRAYRDTWPEWLIRRDEVKHGMAPEYWAGGLMRARTKHVQNKRAELDISRLLKYSREFVRAEKYHYHHF